MAQILINEVSQNYTFNIGSNSYATVAMPITAMWGPCYMDPETIISSEMLDENDSAEELMLEKTQWLHFPATQEGLEAFVSTYRGPTSNYKFANDYSYQMAMTLLTAGYDVLTCRVCPGTITSIRLYAYESENSSTNSGYLIVKAKYPGSFGNKLKINLHKIPNKNYWNLITYVVDSSNVQTALENIIFTLDEFYSTDTIPYISEIESNFLTFDNSNLGSKFSNGKSVNDAYFDILINQSSGSKISNGQNVFFMLADDKSNSVVIGSDVSNSSDASNALKSAKRYAENRFIQSGFSSDNDGNVESDYINTYTQLINTENFDLNTANVYKYQEWIYTAAYYVYGLLADKLNYNPQFIISPGWDDQHTCRLDDSEPSRMSDISPLHKRIMEVAYYSRCACGMIDIPLSCARKYVYDESETTPGYAQMLARINPMISNGDVNSILYPSHSALFAPWGSYKYVGMGKQYKSPPSFLVLLLQRAMILNQSLQYYWALPTNRKHNLRIGKMDYKVPKKVLDIWQKLEGVGVNAITTVPELGLNIWGNSTLFEVPPATYQALANLSTRYLVNAIEDIAYKSGLSITFQYNNEQAYNKFYAGVTPTLDTMKNVGAIDDYYVKMSADINGLDQVNANTVIGKIYLVINGVINDIIVDLIALPPGTDLNQYRS